MNTYIFINDIKQDIHDTVWANSFTEALEYALPCPDDEPVSSQTVYGQALDYTTVCQLYSEGAWK